MPTTHASRSPLVEFLEAILRLSEKDARHLATTDEVTVLRRLLDGEREHGICEGALLSPAVDAIPPP
jgi:hypothetical protein